MAALLSHPAVTLALLLALVGTVLFAVTRLHQVLPRGSRVEAWMLRWTGAAQALVVLLGLLAAVSLAYPSEPGLGRWLTAAVLLIALWSMRHALSDWASGLVLRAEGTLRVGARIGVDGARSRILRLGLRSAEVETESGRLLRLPYGTLAQGTVEVSPEETVSRSHTFSVEAPGGDAGEQIPRIVAAAVLSPWSAAQPTPTVRLIDESAEGARFEVTVYPVAPSEARKVEEAVRAAVSG
jgi:small-conductance mechanosensitive channel